VATLDGKNVTLVEELEIILSTAKSVVNAATERLVTAPTQSSPPFIATDVNPLLQLKSNGSVNHAIDLSRINARTSNVLRSLNNVPVKVNNGWKNFVQDRAEAQDAVAGLLSGTLLTGTRYQTYALTAFLNSDRRRLNAKHKRYSENQTCCRNLVHAMDVQILFIMVPDGIIHLVSASHAVTKERPFRRNIRISEASLRHQIPAT
jgi:hypothetical protein